MKAEERHELKENNLQNWVQYGLPVWLKQNGSYLLLALAVVILAIQLWRMYAQKQERKVQGAVRELLDAERPDAENRILKLQGIIDQYDFRPIRALALRDLGNAYLEYVARGTTDDGKPVDKEDVLHRAQAAFDEIIQKYSDQPLAVGGAKLGLPTIAEDRGDWEGARKGYQELMDKSSPFFGTAVALDAEVKLKVLEKVKDSPRLAALLPPPSTHPATAPSSILGPPGLFQPPGLVPLPPEAPATTRPESAAPPATLPATAPAK